LDDEGKAPEVIKREQNGFALQGKGGVIHRPQYQNKGTSRGRSSISEASIPKHTKGLKGNRV